MERPEWYEIFLVHRLPVFALYQYENIDQDIHVATVQENNKIRLGASKKETLNTSSTEKKLIL